MVERKEVSHEVFAAVEAGADNVVVTEHEVVENQDGEHVRKKQNSPCVR